MGLEVSGINTVNYSTFSHRINGSATNITKGNHTGYRQFKGTKTSAGQIWDLYTGLQQSHLDDFDILLSGYIPSAEAVEAVGKIAMDLKNRDSNKPGSFFWSMYNNYFRFLIHLS
jgi:pyridoxine kinase